MTTESGHRLKTFSLRMEKELRQALENQAKSNCRTLTDEINRRLRVSLEGQSTQVTATKRLTKESEKISKKLDRLLEKSN